MTGSEWVSQRIREGYLRAVDAPHPGAPADPPPSRKQRLLRALTRFLWRDFGKGF